MSRRTLFSIIILMVLATIFLLSPKYKSKTTVADKYAASTTRPSLLTGSEVEAKLNQYRASQGLSPLSDSPALDTAAQVRAEGMCAANNWSHDGAWGVLSPYYNYQTAGENLYYGQLKDDQATDAVKTWVASPSHQKNMVGEYAEMGVGIKLCPGFQGRDDAVIVTNYFGVPR